uniref:Uncharacterized protein n=1 Tax=viral metagenome TaxID=1070528 RepID=A0A6C0EHX1_9ZZZZ
MSLLSAFNTQLVNLSDNLCEMYPGDTDIHFTNSSLHLFKKSNPRQLYTMCNKYIKIYHKKILDKDDGFFLKNDFNEHYEDNGLGDNKNIENIINNLKKYWTVMDDDSKENIWKYLQVLVVLNDKLEK